MPAKPPEVPKPNTPVSKSWLRFLPAGLMRDAGEILLAAIPGIILLTLLILAVGLLNIFQSGGTNPTDWFAPVYIPVVCLLPLVVGIISSLLLERVRGVDTLSLKRSALTAAFSGLVGSVLGLLLLVISGLISPSLKPFGRSLSDPLIEIAILFLVALISTVLSAIGSIVLVIFLSRAEK